jgi:hypothetical protein
VAGSQPGRSDKGKTRQKLPENHLDYQEKKIKNKKNKKKYKTAYKSKKHIIHHFVILLVEQATFF